MLSTRLPVDHGHRTASCDTSLIVSGSVDCGRRPRNVYDKKPQRYAKDNRIAHLTARSDNNNNNNNPICKALKALASEALSASQSWVLLKSLTEEVR